MPKVKKAEFTNSPLGDEFIDSCEYLSSFACVEDLKIDSPFWLKITLEEKLPNCPTFHNLKKLTLGWGCIQYGFDALPFFLKHYPNLEPLTLEEEEFFRVLQI